MNRTILEEELKKRILVLDGAMGTMLQQYILSEEQFKGERFKNHNSLVRGNNDLLSLTQPDIINEIHIKYLDAGSDIIETNTFNANKISQADYGLEDYVYEMNYEAAKIAKKAANNFSTKQKPRFVAGSMGPTNKTASLSPDVSDPGFRAVTFDDLAQAYEEQAKGLIDGGVDILLIETIFDTLNAKAALYGINQIFKKKNIELPIMVSVTIADTSGRNLSGQTVQAFLTSLSHYNLLSIGLNCSFGADGLRTYIKELSKIASFYVSAYPNAGLPNQFGEYDENPEIMGEKIRDYLASGFVNIIGGCCGTTDEHIRMFSNFVADYKPREIPKTERKTRLAGLEELVISKESNFVNIGERTNVAGSRKFARLIREEKYEEALSIARNQVDNGAQVIDVNMDDAMLDAEKEMVVFLNLMVSEPEIARLPFMIDSSKWTVIEKGLKCLQGKGIVNSISLKEGEQIFIDHAKKIKEYGAAVVVMAFDEKGQAASFERRTEICKRAYDILVQKVNFPAEDIIFDPNVLAIGTGIEEHNSFAVDFIKTVAWIKENLPYAKVSGGISNLSFSFRGNNVVREAIHSVFLYYAINAGMDMGIVNPGMLQIYDDIEPKLKELIEDLVLNKRPDATERLIEFSQNLSSDVKKEKETESWRLKKYDERLKYALLKGITDYLEPDLDEAVKNHPFALDIIEQVLMDGMNVIGELFGQGKMFLPQIVKSARVMKKAVAYLQPYIEKDKQGTGISSNGKILLATVKGDVHDIGKNIVSVILSCNSYDIIDLGVMVQTDLIVQKAIEEKVDAIGLSGLITPSLEEMVEVAREMQKHKMKIPLLIGGATTSSVHTAVKIDSCYDGPVIYVKDASQSVKVLNNIIKKERSKDYLKSVQDEYENIRNIHSKVEQKKTFNSLNQIRKNAPKYDFGKQTIVKPQFVGSKIIENYSVEKLSKFIDWTYFFHVWDLKGKYPEILQHKKHGAEAQKIFNDAKDLLQKIIDNKLLEAKGWIGIFPANSVGDNIEVYESENSVTPILTIPLLRQQESNKNNKCLCLSDFIAPKASGKTDYIGLFAVTAGIGVQELVQKYETENNDYNSIMVKAIADRLAESFAEVLHMDLRNNFWGYSKNENLSLDDLIKVKYQGIRPAIGYPSLPDISINKDIFECFKISEKTGINITESFMMNPTASVSGLYFVHPESEYFSIGKIDKDQLEDYSTRKGSDLISVKKYLTKNI